MRGTIKLVPLFLLSVSCAESTGPAPQPVSLEITPAALELGIGEAQTLAVHVRDGQDRLVDPPTGLQVEWVSSDPAHVVVDAGGRVRGERIGSATITAAAVVDGVEVEGRADVSVLGAEFEQDDGAAAHATLGPEGGTLSATAADGARYTLTVPAGALLEETDLSITPLGAIEHFPGGGEAAAGAHFAPDGLRFYVPATLTIDLPDGSDARGYTGFSYREEGADLHLYPTIPAGTTLSYSIPHFSGYGLSRLTPAEIADFPSPTHAGALAQQALVQLLARSSAGEPVEDDEFVALVRFWYTDVLRPALIAAVGDPGADDGAYLAAELEYLVWQRAVLLYGPFLGTVLDSERAEAASLLAGTIRGAIDAHNQRCRNANDLGAAFRVARFQRVAVSFGFDGVGEFGLDPASVLDTLCLDVVIEELNFPETIEPGEEGTLDLRAGYRIEGHPTGFTSFLLIDVFASAGSSGDHLSGITSEAGHYAATVAWPDGEPALALDITACLDWGGLFPEMEVCEERRVVKEVRPLVMETTFPDTVQAGTPAPLRVRVGRQMTGGGIEYQAGHLVELAVTGGSAAPSSGTSDGDGYVEAEITADAASEMLTVLIITGETVTASVQAVIVPVGRISLDNCSRYARAFISAREDSTVLIPHEEDETAEECPDMGTLSATASVSGSGSTEDGWNSVEGSADAWSELHIETDAQDNLRSITLSDSTKTELDVLRHTGRTTASAGAEVVLDTYLLVENAPVHFTIRGTLKRRVRFSLGSLVSMVGSQFQPEESFEFSGILDPLPYPYRLYVEVSASAHRNSVGGSGGETSSLEFVFEVNPPR